MVWHPASAILTYHSLDSSGGVTSLAPDLFQLQMEWLAASGIPVVPLPSIRQNPGAVAITFDDGFRTFLTSALPVLRQYEMPATVFAVSGYCGRSGPWMSWEELAEAASQGVAIGAHGVNHVNLSKVPPARAVEELRESRQDLEDRLGVSVRVAAYPYGVSTPAVREWARHEFDLCCGTQLEFVTAASDAADLPRLDVYYLQRMWWFRRVTRPAGRGYLAVRAALRQVRAAFESRGPAERAG